MKLSRRGKSARRGRHTKRAGKHLRYRGKKVRASKRYHRAHKRTYKRGRRVHRGGVLPQGEPSEFSLPPPGAFYLPQPPQELQELPTFVPGQFQKTLHLYYTKTSDVGSRFSVSKFSVDDKYFKIVGNYLNLENRGNPAIFTLIMTRLGDAVGKTVSFSINLTVEYTVVEESTPDKGRREIGDIMANPITYIDSKEAKRTFYADPGGCNGLLNIKSKDGSIYDFRTGTEGGMAYNNNGPELMEIVDSIENQIKNKLAQPDVTTKPDGRDVISPYASLPDASGPKKDEIFLPPRLKRVPTG